MGPIIIKVTATTTTIVIIMQNVIRHRALHEAAASMINNPGSKSQHHIWS